MQMIALLLVKGQDVKSYLYFFTNAAKIRFKFGKRLENTWLACPK